jgi:hypothetical protein
MIYNNFIFLIFQNKRAAVISKNANNVNLLSANCANIIIPCVCLIRSLIKLICFQWSCIVCIRAGAGVWAPRNKLINF